MNTVADFLAQSDTVMRLLILISVASVAVMAWKASQLKKLGAEVRALAAISSFDDVAGLPEGPVKTMAADIAAYPPDGAVSQFVNARLGMLESLLMARVSVLGLVATLAPMLGLIGTFTGVFHVFEGVSSLGLTDPRLVARGIKEVLLDTVAGLLVAIPAMIAYKVFQIRAAQYALEAENALLLLLGRKRNNA